MALPVVKVVVRFVDPSVERKLRLPPVQPPEPVAGQVMVNVPAGVATLDVMLTPELVDVEPPELLRLP
jgi:spore maturation protein SpmA